LRNNRKAFVSFIPKTLIEKICKSEKITLGSDSQKGTNGKVSSRDSMIFENTMPLS